MLGGGAGTVFGAAGPDFGADADPDLEPAWDACGADFDAAAFDAAVFGFALFGSDSSVSAAAGDAVWAADAALRADAVFGFVAGPDFGAAVVDAGALFGAAAAEVFAEAAVFAGRDAACLGSSAGWVDVTDLDAVLPAGAFDGEVFALAADATAGACAGALFGVVTGDFAVTGFFGVVSGDFAVVLAGALAAVFAVVLAGASAAAFAVVFAGALVADFAGALARGAVLGRALVFGDVGAASLGCSRTIGASSVRVEVSAGRSGTGFNSAVPGIGDDSPAASNSGSASTAQPYQASLARP